MKIILTTITVITLTLTLLQSEEVNIYTHRHYEADQKLYAQFEKKTGIKVNVVKAKADQLIERLKVEGKKSPADLLITVDAGRLYRAKQLGLLKSVQSKTLIENIPERFRDSENFWFGLTKRARVIVYDPSKTDVSKLSSYEDLIDRSWKKKIVVRSSGNIYNQSLLASLIYHHGEQTAKTWAEGIVQNMARKPKGNDRDQMKALVAGIGEVAIVNTYYLGLLLNSQNRDEVKVGNTLKVFFPNQSNIQTSMSARTKKVFGSKNISRGTHINISGIAVTSSSKNSKRAIELIEFLTSVDAQKEYAEANYEYPINPKAPWSELLKSWGTFQEDQISMEELGKNNTRATKVFDMAGWR